VCEIERLCCDLGWDADCAALAESLCCPADLDGDGQVDGTDVGTLLSVFGEESAAGDFNCDGIVDSADLGILLAGWGECAP